MFTTKSLTLSVFLVVCCSVYHLFGPATAVENVDKNGVCMLENQKNALKEVQSL